MSAQYIEHYAEADAQARLANQADSRGDVEAFHMHVALGQLHATLALAAATVLATGVDADETPS